MVAERALCETGRLDFRLIRVRSRASVGYREAVAALVMDGADPARTHHRSPENRKDGGSTPPLATPAHQRGYPPIQPYD